MLDEEHLKFARQCGATHIVAHLVDYFHNPDAGQETPNQPLEKRGGYWGVAGRNLRLWEKDEMLKIKERIESHGLEWYAIENLDPALWYDVLLDGPEKERQLDHLCAIVSRMGEVGIRVLGYNFSLAGVYGRTKGPYARAGAESVGMDGFVDPGPMPDGVVWNMLYDPDAQGVNERSRITTEELWKRLNDFLQRLLPVAEKAGVALALHPDDPPVDRIRDTPRLVNHPDLYRKLLGLHPSRSNQIEYCVGTLSEMKEGDIYEATREYGARHRIAYVHLRNVVGKVPHYKEVFIDEGDIDVRQILGILHDNRFDGVIIPDHTPLMSCPAPWHAGMAYAMGYLKSVIDALEKNSLQGRME